MDESHERVIAKIQPITPYRAFDAEAVFVLPTWETVEPTTEADNFYRRVLCRILEATEED